MSRALLPPATIGIIGGGQLGMMTIREAQRMGYRSAVWDPDPDCPASRLADETITAPFDDEQGAQRLAQLSDVITYEFEHIDVDLVASLEQVKTVRPGHDILRVAQHRRIEKDELNQRGFPVAEYRIVESNAELADAVKRLGLPVVIKTTSAGYDGKGQSVLRSQHDVEVFEFSDEVEYAVERFLDLACELSVVVVRDQDGQVFNFPVSKNEHRDNILHSSIVPAGVTKKTSAGAERLARDVAQSFGIVGVLCVEMFVTKSGEVLVNELAPRPHNSGHYTLDACDLSQFEALVRVTTGLPMRAPKLLRPAAIVNLLGKHLTLLDLEKLQKIPGTKLHLYGKRRVEPKRKMGHVAIIAEKAEDVLKAVREVEALIGEG